MVYGGLCRDNGKENGNYYIIIGYRLGVIDPHNSIEYGFGYIIIRSPYIP